MHNTQATCRYSGSRIACCSFILYCVLQLPYRRLETLCRVFGKSWYLLKRVLLLMQGAGAPNVGQVLSGRSYTPSSADVVTPVAAGVVPLSSAYVDGTGHVTNVSTASAYDVYLVGQDDNKSPNTMTTVCPLWL